MYLIKPMKDNDVQQLWFFDIQVRPKNWLNAHCSVRNPLNFLEIKCYSLTCDMLNYCLIQLIKYLLKQLNYELVNIAYPSSHKVLIT